MKTSIIGNPVSNAIKFSEPGTTITLRSPEAGDMMEIEVIDRGIGIPPGILDNLFSATKKTSRPETCNEKGTGFGMPIVLSSVKACGGEIRVSSRTQAAGPEKLRGTRFLLLLHRSAATLKAAS